MFSMIALNRLGPHRLFFEKAKNQRQQQQALCGIGTIKIPCPDS